MNAEIIAIQDDDIAAKACGAISFWQLHGNVTRQALALALVQCGVNFCEAPDEPSAVVALHRAVEAVAKEIGGDAHSTKHGHWAIVGAPHEQTGAVGEQIVYDVKASAEIVREYTGKGAKRELLSETLRVEGQGCERIREAFDIAKGVITGNDISGWLCKRLEKLGAVALRESGGFYFLPQDACAKWEQIKRAVHAASSHKIHGVPALRSKDAVDAILSAIETETRKECDQIGEEIAGNVGKRALETREKRTTELLERIARYEELLGVKLEALRDATKATRAAVATTLLGLESEDA